jgi:hypothetical protein
MVALGLVAMIFIHRRRRGVLVMTPVAIRRCWQTSIWRLLGAVRGIAVNTLPTAAARAVMRAI